MTSHNKTPRPKSRETNKTKSTKKCTTTFFSLHPNVVASCKVPAFWTCRAWWNFEAVPNVVLDLLPEAQRSQVVTMFDARQKNCIALCCQVGKHTTSYSGAITKSDRVASVKCVLNQALDGRSGAGQVLVIAMIQELRLFHAYRTTLNWRSLFSV